MRTAAVALLVTSALGTAACSGGERGPSTLTVPTDERTLAFGPGANGATLVTTASVSSVVAAGADPVSTSYTVPTGPVSAQPAGGSIDLAGQPWWVSGDAVPATTSGAPHPAAPKIEALQGRVAAGVVRHADPWGTAVVDATAVLVATNTQPGTTFWKAANSVVYRVTAQGSTPVAGGGGDTADPVSTLQARSLKATSVRLDLVQAVAPLTSQAFALVMTAPTDDDDATSATLEAAYVRDGMVSSVPLPGQCAGQHVTRAARATDTTIVISAPHRDQTHGCTSTMDWVEVDLTTGDVTTLGSGTGYGYVDANGQLVTATRSADDPTQVLVQWQDRPAG